MKICKRCAKEFDEDKEAAYSPTKDFRSQFADQNLCPKCKEEFWMLNALGSLDS